MIRRAVAVLALPIRARPGDCADVPGAAALISAAGRPVGRAGRKHG
jgi:hypothetical protein